MNLSGEVVAVCKSEEKGLQKKNFNEGILIKNHGLKGDAHSGDWHRQVSLLALESIDKMREQGLDVSPGAFAENLTTKNMSLYDFPIGTELIIADTVKLVVTQIGKECHDRCAIYHQAGDCVMPKEGIFAEVVQGGPVNVGDPIEVILSSDK